jgi:hypothetical protein
MPSRLRAKASRDVVADGGDGGSATLRGALRAIVRI